MVFNISNGTVGWLEYQQTKYMIGLLSFHSIIRFTSQLILVLKL